MREPTVRATLTGVLRVDLLDNNTIFFDTVLSVLGESLERLFVTLRRASPLADVNQVLELEDRTFVLANGIEPVVDSVRIKVTGIVQAHSQISYVLLFQRHVVTTNAVMISRQHW